MQSFCVYENTIFENTVHKSFDEEACCTGCWNTGDLNGPF